MISDRYFNPIGFCTACWNVILPKRKDDGEQDLEFTSSAEAPAIPDSEGDIFGTFVLKAHCCTCKQLFHVSGDGSNGVGDWNCNMVYTIKHTTPAMVPFNPSHVSDDILRASLIRAGELYYSDNKACANAIRSTLEVLLDQLGVCRQTSSGKPVDLHNRIMNWPVLPGFPEANSNVVDRFAIKVKLLGLKFLCNDGSHGEAVDEWDTEAGMTVVSDLVSLVDSWQHKRLAQSGFSGKTDHTKALIEDSVKVTSALLDDSASRLDSSDSGYASYCKEQTEIKTKLDEVRKMIRSLPPVPVR